MQRSIKLSPVLVLKIVLIVAALLAVGLRFGLVPTPWQTANAQEALCDTVDGQCPQDEPLDVCWNLQGIQETVPDGYVIDESQDNSCVEETVPEEKPQVLGESTTKTPTPVVQSTPEVLGEQTGK